MRKTDGTVGPSRHHRGADSLNTRSTRDADSLIYQADEAPPAKVTLALGAQLGALTLGGVIFHPSIVHTAAGSSEEVIAWAVFASLLITAASSALQAFPIRQCGAGYLLVTATVAPGIALSIDALKAGGAALLATLIGASALFQWAFAGRIAAFRRILTPSVSGTILMLIAVSVAPIGFERIDGVPTGHRQEHGLACALMTLGIMTLVALKGGKRLRPWAPIMGILAGGATAAAYGMYDIESVKEAAWVGMPQAINIVVDFNVSADFWRLLPAFVLVSMALSIRTMGAALAIQDVSWRTPRAADFRPVQGAVRGDSIANLLAAVGGGIVMGTRTQTIAQTVMTGVSARIVGIAFGAVLGALAFLPKVTAVVIALPEAVLGGYVVALIAALFTAGLKMVVSDGLDRRQGLVVGLSFFAGVGCEYELIAPELLAGFAGGVLENGLVAGGLMAILMTAFLEITSGRRHKLETELHIAELATIKEFVADVARKQGWGEKMTARLEAVAEETLLTLVEEDQEPRRRLRINVHSEGNAAVLEFTARPSESNIEDRIAMLGDAGSGAGMERDISLRLLRHLAAQVRHRQYRDMDFITVRVENSTVG